MVGNATVLAYVNPSLPIGIACGASNVGLAFVLFQHYKDLSERTIVNASKILIFFCATTVKYRKRL